MFAAVPNIVHLMGVLHGIILCGQALFLKLVQPDAVPNEDLTRYYATAELPRIVRYVLRGVLRAEVLSIVLRERAKRGVDAKEWVSRKPANRQPPGEDKKRDPNRQPKPPRPEEDLPYAYAPPSRKALFAWVRRRSPGAALKAICLDLAVLKDDLGPEKWQEIARTINRFGGNAVTLFQEICERWLPLSAAEPRKNQRRRNAEPSPEPARPVVPRALMPLRDLVEPLVQALRRSRAAA